MPTFDTRHIGPLVKDAISLSFGSLTTERKRTWLVEVGRQVRNAAFESSDDFPTIDVNDLLAALPGTDPDAVLLPPSKSLFGNTVGGITPYYYVGLICAFLRPAVSFEFGTFLGLSALTVALNTDPEARIYTVDLPDEFSGEDVSTLTMGDRRLVDKTAGIVGRAFRGHPLAHKIVQIRCNSLEVDVGAYCDKIDFAFVDGGHSYELVKSDTEKCLNRLAPGGVIVWDDYRWNLPGVSTYVQELRKTIPLRRLAGTQYVVYSDRLNGKGAV